MIANRLKKFVGIFAICVAGSIGYSANATESDVELDKAPINLKDFASMQRGAKVYVNNCQGCHSLKYARYKSLAEGIGITDEEGNVLDSVVKANLMFVGDKITSPMLTAIPEKDAEAWFGKVPPDLSLVARSRGVDWLYTYMRSFYRDDSKTWGVNNLVFPDVGMPHVLANLQGVQEPVFKEVEVEVDGEKVIKQEVVGLKLAKQGMLKPAEYDSLVADLVNFLSYVGEPVKLERERIGVFVLAFLAILLIFAYLLKREYWKDIK